MVILHVKCSFIVPSARPDYVPTMDFSCPEEVNFYIHWDSGTVLILHPALTLPSQNFSHQYTYGCISY